MSAILYTGNVLKHDIEPDLRLSGILSHIFDHWVSEQSSNEHTRTLAEIVKQNGGIFPAFDLGINTSVQPSATECLSKTLSLTAKLFLPRVNLDEAKQALSEALTVATKIYPSSGVLLLILSFNDICLDRTINGAGTVHKKRSQLDQDIANIWKYAVKIGEVNGVQQFGVADFSASRLGALFELSGDGVLPTVDHISLNQGGLEASTPQDLIDLAEKNSISLVAHNDPKLLLPSGELTSVLRKIDANIPKYKTDWVLKLTYFENDTKVIKSTKYLTKVSPQ